MVGAFATALMLIILWLLQALLGAFVVGYGLRWLMLAATETAAGNDVVARPGEPFTDWIGGSLYPMALAAIWLIPVGLVGRVMRADGYEGPLALPLLLAGIGWLWLVLPISLLSALSGESRWALLRPAVLRQLARAPLSVMGFYLGTAPLALACAGLTYLAVFRLGWLLPLAGMAWAATFLIYGRLLGRIAFVLDQLKPARRNRPKAARSPRPGPVHASQDAWPVPDKPVATKKRPSPRPSGVYGLAADNATPPRPPKPTPATEYDGYALKAMDPAESKRPPLPDVAAPSEFEMKLARPPRRPDAPRRPLLSGVYTFPWYPHCRTAWVLLSLGMTAVGALHFLMRGYLSAVNE